ncbi:MAG: hypothetical protein P9L97_05715 [Candidatus Tenebribacter davisii]|nr:hypothetical protein [Candidatus Tenebribacter davisii]
MKVLKKRFRKIQKEEVKRIPKKIIKAKKMGRWCEYYDGRLPFPMECSGNKELPVAKLYKDGVITILHNRPNCVACKRAPEFQSWKRGDWRKITEAIENGEDLRDHPSPTGGE